MISSALLRLQDTFLVGEKGYFILAMSIILVWRFILYVIKNFMQRKCFCLANYIYGGAGSLYFTGAFFGMILLAILLMYQYEFIAIQTANVIYYLLIIGACLEIVALCKKK